MRISTTVWLRPTPYSSSRSSSKYSLLPGPYLNTTHSQPASLTESVSYSIPASTTASTISTTSFRPPIPGGDNGELPDPEDPATSTTSFVDNPPPPPPPETATTTSPSQPTHPIPPKGQVPEPEDPPPPPENEQPPPENEVGGDDGEEASSTTKAASSAPQAEYTPPPAVETPPAASPPASQSIADDEGENVHTTAFVIEPITGRALITYESEPTKTSDDVRAPEYTGGSDSGVGDDGSGAEDADEPTQTAGTDTSNLLDAIGQVANGGQDSSSGSTDSSDSPASDSSNSPGSDENSSPVQDSTGQNSPGDSVEPADIQDTDPPAQDGGIDLSQLNSAIDSVVSLEYGGGDGGAQATSPANANVQPGSIYSAGNTVVTAQAGGNVIIGEQTVSPAQSITIGSGPSTTVIALQTNGGTTDLVVAGSTFQASPANSAVTAQSNGAVVFDGSTVQPGQSVTFCSGPSATVVALQTHDGSTDLIVGGSTVNVLPAGSTITAAPGANAVTGVASIALITTNGQTITAIQSGSSLILQSGGTSTTVAAGDAATFAGETILAVPTEDAVFVNGNIIPLTGAEGVEGASQAVITANGHTITAVDSGNSVVLIDGSVTATLEDGSDIVFQGQTISAQGSGMAVVVVNGHTSSLSSAIALATGQAIVTAGDHIFSALDLPGYVVLHDGTSSLTIRDGATATFDGQVITALANGDAVVVNGQTMSMTEPVNVATAEAVITAGGHTFTAQDMDGYVLLEDGTSTLTVKDGSTIIFGGQTVQALSSGEAVVVNGKTTSLTSVEASATANLDDYINRGLSGGSSTSSQTADAASPEATDGANANAASTLSMSCAALVIAGLFGVIATL